MVREYPYEYGQVRDTNEFFTSTEGIGLTELSQRALIVASTGLQALPPNLLRVQGEFAGWTRALEAAPSLTWLESARRNPFTGDGRRLAWIPREGSEDTLDPLNVVVGELEGTLAQHGIPLSTTTSLPAGARGADLAIIAAHGGLTEEDRFFRVVADDSDVKFTPAALAGSLAGVGTVVLFVCSGGRIDKHPGSSAVLGMAKRLLARGCRAVVAPTWPLEVSVPGVWLPGFSGRVGAGCSRDRCVLRREHGGTGCVRLESQAGSCDDRTEILWRRRRVAAPGSLATARQRAQPGWRPSRTPASVISGSNRTSRHRKLQVHASSPRARKDSHSRDRPSSTRNARVETYRGRPDRDRAGALEADLADRLGLRDPDGIA